MLPGTAAPPGRRREIPFLAGGLGLVIRHASALLAGLAGQRLGTLVTAVLLGRYLLPGGFGQYLFILSLLEIAVLGVSLASQTIVVRTVAEALEDRGIYAAALWLRAGLALVAYPLFVLTAVLLGSGPLVRSAAVMGLGMVANALAEVPLGVLLGRREMTAKAVLDGAVSALGVALFWTALAMGGGIEGAAWAYAGRGLVNLVAAYLVCRRRTGTWPAALVVSRVRELARQSLPLFGDSLAVTFYTRVTPILLLVWISDAAAGLYGGAFRIFEMITLVGTVTARAAFPTISRATATGAGAGRDLVRRLMTLVLLLALPVALTVSALARWLLTALLGPSFAEAAPVLRILLAAAPLIYVYDVAIHYLYALRRQRDVLLVNLAGIVVSLSLNALLIPRLKLTGAALAVLAGEILLFAVYLALVRRRGVGPSVGALVPGFAAVLGAAVTGGSPAWLMLWIGCGVLAVALGLKTLRPAAGVPDWT